jgi:hypothetical protein
MSKSDELIARLREGWQSIDDLHALLFWQPHTIRGAISTAAKKHGVTVERRRIDGVTSYRITQREAAE